MFSIAPIQDTPRTWKVIADGIEIKPQLLTISSDPYGTLTLGLRPEGFHGWAFKPKNGGVMTIPWSKTPTGEILIGLIHEHRPNMGNIKTWSPPGGFIDGGESPTEAAQRESLEEGGLDTKAAEKLPGLPVNSDRLYFTQDPHLGEGMQFFAMNIPFNSLELVGEKEWKPKKGVINHKKESDLYFLPWRNAVLLSADSLALSGITRLLSVLL